MNAVAIRPGPAARGRAPAGFSCAAAALNLPSMNDVATPGVEARDDISDEALMLAYAAGRTDAFEQLYARHRTRLYRFLLRQLRDAALADDLFQDIWQRMIAARAGWTPDDSFASWLYRIAHNRIADHGRAQQYEIAVSVMDIGNDLFIAVPRHQPFTHQDTQIAGQIGIAVINGLVLTDQTAQFLGNLPRAGLHRRIGQFLVRHDRQGGQRKGGSKRDNAQKPFHLDSSLIIGRMVSSTSNGINGPTWR